MYAIRQRRQTKPKARGRELESRIESVFEKLNKLCSDILCIRLNVNKISTKRGIIYTAKQPCDYVIFRRSGLPDIAFDAKECSGPVWYPSKAEDHQREALTKLQRMGHRAGFVVWFVNEPLVGLRFIEDFSKPVRPTDGIAFDWQWIMSH